MAVVGLLLVAGIAYLGSFASGTLYIYVRDAPADWKHLTVTFSDIQVHRAAAGGLWIGRPVLGATEVTWAGDGRWGRRISVGLEAKPADEETKLGPLRVAGGTPPRRHSPSRRCRIWYDRNARRKSIFRKPGQ